MTPELAAGLPSWLAGSLEWIHANPGLSIAILGFTTCVEGLFLIGLVIPGSALMIAAGAIAVAGEIPLVPVLLAAAIGAWLGDLLSFWIGYRYRDQLDSISCRLHLPGAIDRGQRFFSHHGGKSIILGRFIGPLRPLVPAIAGAARMRFWQFLVIDLIAALLWAPAYALPGVLVGATISLAAEVATRLAVLMTLIFLLSWLIWWLVSFAVRLLQNHAEPWIAQLMDWSHKHRRLGNLGPALADPHQPESPILLICLLIISAVSALLGHLWWGWPGTLGPPAIDALAYDTLAALLSPGVMPLAQAAAQIGSIQVTALMGLGMLLMFASQLQHRLTAHWIAGLVGGSLIGIGLPGGGQAISPEAILDSTAATAVSLSIWLTLAGLLASRHRSAHRIIVYSCTGLILGLMLLARLMLAHISFSQLALAFPSALIWCSLLSLGFRRHLRQPQVPALLPSAGLALLLLSLGLTLGKPDPKNLSSGWAQTDAAAMRLNVFWQAEPEAIADSMRSHGWTALETTQPRQYLQWMLAESEQRPPAPQWLAGKRPDMRFTKRTQGQKLILRLWRDLPNQYAGQISLLRQRHLGGLLHVPMSKPSLLAMDELANDVAPAWQITRGKNQTPLFIFPNQ